MVKKTTELTDIVISNGVHLMLVLKDMAGNPNIVLDYVFGTQKAPDDTKVDAGKLLLTDDTSSDAKSGMAAYSKNYHGLAVRNIGFHYAENAIAIKVDASVTFCSHIFQSLWLPAVSDIHARPKPQSV